jgi:uncharacterized protein (TIGR02444 family)
MRSSSAEGFWRFSLAFYARPQVAEALIALQDRAGHNANLILFGLWAGACEGARLDSSAVAAARAAIEPLDRAIVAPLRTLRRRLKADPDIDVQALRRRIAALELAAERRVQYRLAANLRYGDPADGRLAAAQANLALILGAAESAEAAALAAALAAFLARG